MPAAPSGFDGKQLSSLRCPDCHCNALSKHLDVLKCGNCGNTFPVVHRKPVLLRHDNSLFELDRYLSIDDVKSYRQNRISRFLPGLSVNLASDRILPMLRGTLDSRGCCSVLIIGGGTQRNWLDPLLCRDVPHELVYSDIDITSDVDIFCDGHDLPFVDGSFDAIVTTAVLEHVMYPEKVATEIARVLKTDGLLYSELPFMQQVHEGAYDFTRYTLSGHRRLFNQFKEIEAGMVAGPGTALAWALENFLLAFVAGIRSRVIVKGASRLFFSWVRYFDYFLERRPQAMDGASCTYFYGAKSEQKVPDDEIIRSYVGAKHLTHI